MTSDQAPPKYLFIVEAEFDAPELEEEWNRWYDEDHIPVMCSVPGFVSATRYKERGTEGRYIAIYELSDPGAPWSDECMKVAGWGEWRSHIVYWRRATYRLEDDFIESKRK